MRTIHEQTAGVAARRATLLTSAVVTLALLLSSLPPATAGAQAVPFCRPGESPAFTFGFADLKTRLGPIMGDPIECAHPNDANGDVLQQTTTGLSFWRKSTNTPTFTDGYRHWGLTPVGMVMWLGSDIDPPGTVAVPPVPPAPAAPRPVTAPAIPAAPPVAPSVPAVPPTAPPPTSAPQPAQNQTSNCHPSYPDFCIPPPPPDLDCTSPSIRGRGSFAVRGPDPHRFDGDNDGIGCER